jgi:hypothetical protein
MTSGNTASINTVELEDMTSSRLRIGVPAGPRRTGSILG